MEHLEGTYINRKAVEIQFDGFKQFQVIKPNAKSLIGTVTLHCSGSLGSVDSNYLTNQN